MIEIIDKLNTCSDGRTVLYCFVFLCALGILTSGIASIIDSFTRMIKANKRKLL